MKMAESGDIEEGLEGSFDEGMKVEETHTHEESACSYGTEFVTCGHLIFSWRRHVDQHLLISTHSWKER